MAKKKKERKKNQYSSITEGTWETWYLQRIFMLNSSYVCRIGTSDSVEPREKMIKSINIKFNFIRTLYESHWIYVYHL